MRAGSGPPPGFSACCHVILRHRAVDLYEYLLRACTTAERPRVRGGRPVLHAADAGGPSARRRQHDTGGCANAAGAMKGRAAHACPCLYMCLCDLIVHLRAAQVMFCIIDSGIGELRDLSNRACAAAHERTPCRHPSMREPCCSARLNHAHAHLMPQCMQARRAACRAPSVTRATHGRAPASHGTRTRSSQARRMRR